MNRILKINGFSLLSALVLLSCCDIAYINHIKDVSGVLFGFRLLFILIFGINLIGRKKHIKSCKTFFLIVSLILAISCKSLFRSSEVLPYTLKILSKPFLIVLFLQYYSNDSYRIKKILNTWKKLLFLLCFIDFLTILIFPNGMYKDKNYSHNWFLGYKTARLVYSWPLLMITSYLQFEGNPYKKIGFFTYLCFIICIFSSFKSYSTGACTALILYAAFVLYLKYKYREKNLNSLYRIFNVKNVVLSMIVLYGVTMTIESNLWLQTLITTVFNKSATLSNRVDIWKNCFKFFCESPLFGHGIFTPLEYISITKYYLGTNAHNLILTILISGGLFGFLLYLCIFIQSMSRKKHIYTRQEAVLISSIIVYLVVGVTSSAVAFSPFAFCPFILLELDKKRKEKRYEK